MVPASTSARRISSVAYAVEEIASAENTGSASFLESRSCISSAVAIGRPRRACLIIEGAPTRFSRSPTSPIHTASTTIALSLARHQG